MEVSTSLLVALMFVTLLSIGIGNVINTLSIIFEKGKESGYSLLHIGWLGVLLLSFFRLFWHTIDFLSKEVWTFGGFLYVMLGPILLYFATSMLTASAHHTLSEQEAKANRIYGLLLLLQIWIVTIDLILRSTFAEQAIMNGLIGLILVYMLISKSIQRHARGLKAIWALILASVLLSMLA